MKNLVIFADDGHAWLKVKKSVLFDLGIAEKITQYSYQYGEYAYLEEDADLSTFVNAFGLEKWQDIKNTIPVKHSRYSRVRTYSRYIPKEYRKPKIGDFVSFVGNSGIFQITAADTVRDKAGNFYRLPKNRLSGQFFEGF